MSEEPANCYKAQMLKQQQQIIKKTTERDFKWHILMVQHTIIKTTLRVTQCTQPTLLRRKTYITRDSNSIFTITELFPTIQGAKKIILAGANYIICYYYSNIL